MNPHFGTPGNPADRTRCPGGSSSGAAVSVADGMAEIGLGTDTGGSVRVPAHFCGLVGFKPTKARVPTDGVFPLSFLLDSIGPIARSVQDCADADAVLAGDDAAPLVPPALGDVRFAVARGPVMADLDGHVAAAFDAALDRLGRAGARLPTLDLSPIDHMARAGALGGLVPPESALIHRDRLRTHGAGYDPVVRARIAIGERMSAVDAMAALRLHVEGLAAMDAHLAAIDAVLMPTAPIPAPRIADVTPSVETFLSVNAKALRNTYLANFHGLCAISLPIPVAGLPVGLSLVGRANTTGGCWPSPPRSSARSTLKPDRRSGSHGRRRRASPRRSAPRSASAGRPCPARRHAGTASRPYRNRCRRW